MTTPTKPKEESHRVFLHPRGRRAVEDPVVDLGCAERPGDSVGLGARFVEGNSTFVIPARRAPFLFDCDWPEYVLEVLW